MRMRARGWAALTLALVVVAGCRDTAEAPPKPAEPGPVIAGLADRCPNPDTPIPYPPGGRLPAGAVGVRLCNGVEDFGGADDFQPDVQPPHDELTTDVADLVEVVNSSKPPAETEGEVFCPADAGPDLVFWFRYADGSARAVIYQRYGCRWLVVGDGMDHAGGEDLHVAFDERLSAQRSELQPPASAPEPTCVWDPPTTALDLSDRLDLGTAAVCVVPARGDLRLTAVLSPRQMERVARSFEPRPGNTVGPCSAKQAFQLVGYTAWGDRFVLPSDGCTFVTQGLRRSSPTLLWRPDPSLNQMFQRLMAGT